MTFRLRHGGWICLRLNFRESFDEELREILWVFCWFDSRLAGID